MDKNEIRERLLRTCLVSDRDLIGCTYDEVDSYSRKLGFELPASYREYLYAIGNGAGGFLAGTDALFRHLPVIQKEAESLLRECGVKDGLPPGSVVFYMHQGYEFGFFVAPESDDPPVYQYIEGDDLPRLAWPSFSAYVLDMIRMFHTCQEEDMGAV